MPPREYRTRLDPFETVWPKVLRWLDERPDAAAKDMFIRLQEEHPGTYSNGQLRTLQRRVKEWHRVQARDLVLASCAMIALKNTRPTEALAVAQ